MNRIKELRLKEGLTLKELSDSLNEKYEINVSDGQLSNYENENRAPRDKQLWEQIADFFNVSVPYLMGLNDVNPSMTPEDIEVSVQKLLHKNEKDTLPNDLIYENLIPSVIGNIEEEIKNSHNVLSTYFIKFTDKRTNKIFYTVVQSVYMVEKISIYYKKGTKHIDVNSSLFTPDKNKSLVYIVKFNNVRSENQQVFFEEYYYHDFFNLYLENLKSSKKTTNAFKTLINYSLNQEFSHIKNMINIDGVSSKNFRINCFNQEFIDINLLE